MCVMSQNKLLTSTLSDHVSCVRPVFKIKRIISALLLFTPSSVSQFLLSNNNNYYYCYNIEAFEIKPLFSVDHLSDFKYNV